MLAAFIEGIREDAVELETGTLRGDLMQFPALLVEMSRQPALNEALQEQLLGQRKYLIMDILRGAVERGEINEATMS